MTTDTSAKKAANTAYRPEARCALDGVRVLDLSRLVAGNALTHVLADHGAEVIKVEAPGRGDDLRAWRVEGVSTYWKIYARNKKSITLDFRSGRGRDLLLDLVRGAHMLVESFVPGKLERMGLGPDVLHAVNPALVIVRVSGWGQTGPFADKPGFGTLVEARSGFAAMNGFADRPPVLPPLALADMVCGLYGASAAMMALREVELKGGAGQVIDVSLFESIHSILGPEAVHYELLGAPPRRMGSRIANTAPRNVYACSDGKFVALSAAMQSMAEKLFRTIGRPELIDDPRFRTNSDRVRNNDEIDAIVADFMRQRPRAEILALFDAAGVTVGPVSDTEDLAEDPYMEERGIVRRYPDAEIGVLPMHSVVARLSRTPGAIRSPAPDLGQHNGEVFGELGLGPDDLAALRASKTI